MLEVSLLFRGHCPLIKDTVALLVYTIEMTC